MSKSHTQIRRDERASLGLCVECDRKPMPGNKRCREHQERDLKYQAKARRKRKLRKRWALLRPRYFPEVQS